MMVLSHAGRHCTLAAGTPHQLTGRVTGPCQCLMHVKVGSLQGQVSKQQGPLAAPDALLTLLADDSVGSCGAVCHTAQAGFKAMVCQNLQRLTALLVPDCLYGICC